MIFLQQVKSLLAKDFRREWRTKEITTTTVSFALLLVLLASFAFFANEQKTSKVFPGVLWVAIAFTGNLAIGRTFAMERDSGCLRVLALIPGTSTSLYVAKFLFNLFFVGLFETVLIPFLALIFGVPLGRYGVPLWGANMLATISFCAVATLVSAMLVHNKLRDVMMSLILYPLVIPIVIAGVKVTESILQGEGVGAWSGLLLGMDGIAFFLSLVLFRWVLGAIE